ncbi:hypothetical protein [Corynebacterium sp.]|uniref:hypothetical protein n=1 Tax=Corynebacterium sp. TaxID=1720 RepID=UPI0026211CC1|nr:hypothetical protein [Corynebacterium sp.]
MKKTIIALAAASPVALSHGVAVAEEGNTNQSSVEQNTNGSSELKNQLTGSSEKSKEENKDQNQETEGDKDGNTTNPDEKEATGSSKFFGWDETTKGLDKLIAVGAAVAAVVSLLGSISALFANIEKLAKRFTK